MTGEPPASQQSIADPSIALSRHVGRDVAVTFGGRVGLTAVILVGDVILARTLGPEGKGAFTLVLVLSSLAALILGLGMDRSLAVLAARSQQIARRAFANAALWTLATGGLGMVALLVLYGAPAETAGPRGPLAAIMPRLTSAELLLAAIALPFEIAYAIGIIGLLGRQRVVASTVARFARRGVLLALLLPLAALGRLDLQAVLLLNVAALAATVAIIAWAMARAGAVGLRPDGTLLREQLSFGGRAFAATIAERLHYRADAFLLTALIGVGATGVYSVALGLAETMWYLPSAFGLVLFSRAVAPGSDSAGAASAMTRSVLALGVIVGVPLWLAAPTLVELVYGAPFSGAGAALQLMLPGVVAYGAVSILSQYIVASGAPGRVAAVHVCGLVMNVTANLLLIPPLGIQGAALAASVSYSATAAAMVILFTRLSSRGLRETLLIRRADLAGRLPARLFRTVG